MNNHENETEPNRDLQEDRQEDSQNEENVPQERFEDLFESYMAEMKDDLRVGEQVTGEIITITNENVF